MVDKRRIIKTTGISVYSLFIVVSFIMGFDSGKQIGFNFINFLLEMLKVLPCPFILIGLFEVWVKKETIERHFGEASGIRGYIWAVLLAGTTVGGLYVTFPVAYSLHSKGAKLSVIFTYLGASAICRVPLTLFEASFLGIKFSAIRFIVSLPMVIVTSMLLGSYLTKKRYQITEGK